VPKAAGTSIERAFMEDLGLDMDNRHALLLGENTNKTIGPRRISHLTAAQYVDMHYVSKEIYDSYFKFAIVRNPIDRLYSTYKYKRYNDYLSFDDFIKLKLEEFINSESESYFYKPQYDYIYKDGKSLVDFIGRLESLGQDFEFIQKKLGVHLELKHYNKFQASKTALNNLKSYGKLIKDVKAWGKINFKDDSKELSQNSMIIIKKYYDKDFKTFNYIPPKPKRK
tara:strand:- start:274 stop:948 length:675 start_codon:yes stop_codon:yes gene_type:complete